MKGSRFKRGLRKFALVCFWAYLAALLILPVLWALSGETRAVLILLRYAPHVLYLAPLIPLAPLMLFTRARVHPAVLAATAALLLFYYLGFQVGRRGGEPQLSVLSYNIQAGLGGEAAVAAVIKAAQADIVGLQEARKPSVAPQPDPVPGLLERLPGYQMARGGIRGELVTLSRFSILGTRLHDLDGLSECVEARLDVNGESVRVLNVHLMTGDPQGKLKGQGSAIGKKLRLTAETRHVQTAALGKILAHEELPTVLLGDFNTPPRSTAWAPIDQHLGDSFAQVGWGFGYTYKTRIPVWRIDYIWVSSHFQPVAGEVIGARASDHRPLKIGLQRR